MNLLCHSAGRTCSTGVATNADSRANKIRRGKKTEQHVKVDDWADEIFVSSEPLSKVQLLYTSIKYTSIYKKI